jgi:hypothetical protein
MHGHLTVKKQTERTANYNNSLDNILLLSVLVLHVSNLMKAIIGKKLRRTEEKTL